MSDFKDQKREDMEELKDLRASILKATAPDKLEIQIAKLQVMLHNMEARTEGDVKEAVQQTLRMIQAFWMHDRNRAEVCKWMQTIICKLNENRN